MLKKIIVIAGLIVFLILGTWGGQASARKKFMSLGTGSPAGTYYFIGAGFASIWNKHMPQIKVIAESTAASAENVALISKSKMDLGIASSSAVLRAKDLGKLDVKKVRILCSSTYGSHFHIIVRKESPIKTYLDLKGKRVSFGSPGSGTLLSAKEMIKGWGMSEKDFNMKYLSFSEVINALRDKTIDAGLIAAAAPVASIVDLTLTVPVRLIPVIKDQFKFPNKVTQGYATITIPAGTYKGIDEAVSTVASPTFLVIHKDVDNKIAYQLLDVLYGQAQAKNAIHPSAKEFNPQAAFSGVVGHAELFVPYHDGAIQYFKDKKLWPQQGM